MPRTVDVFLDEPGPRVYIGRQNSGTRHYWHVSQDWLDRLAEVVNAGAWRDRWSVSARSWGWSAYEIMKEEEVK